PTFSQIAASPTKVAEYLAAGLPVVCNSGTGDMDKLLLNEKVGVLVENFDEKVYEEAASRALALSHKPQIRERCGEVTEQYFDLVKVGGSGYRNVYRRIEESNNVSSM